MNAPLEAGAGAVRVPVEMQRQMIAHALSERPLEACGLIAGRGEEALAFHPTRNALRSPVRYDVDPRDLLATTLAIEAAGLELWGIFHSHPATEAYPSPTDVRLAHYPDAHYLICSLRRPDAPVLRAFRISGGAIREIAIRPA
jgi:proteasome lid subunit RPN8/RPN11